MERSLYSHLLSSPFHLCFEDQRALQRSDWFKEPNVEDALPAKPSAKQTDSPRHLLVTHTTEHLQANRMTQMPADSLFLNRFCVTRILILAIINMASTVFRYRTMFLFVIYEESHSSDKFTFSFGKPILCHFSITFLSSLLIHSVKYFERHLGNLFNLVWKYLCTYEKVK